MLILVELDPPCVYVCVHVCVCVRMCVCMCMRDFMLMEVYVNNG